MKKINWKPCQSNDSIKVVIGSVTMQCDYFYYGQMAEERTWCASVSMGARCGTFRYGAPRKSIDEAKDDAIRMAREMLIDYDICIKFAMANFGLIE